MTQTKKNALAFFFILSLGFAYFLKYNTKAETSIVITSVSTTSPRVGEKIKFTYQLRSDSSDFTLIALPDTQGYSEAYPEIYLSQTEWVVENKEIRNIVFLSHLGDIVENNDLYEKEWIRADKAMRLLDGVVPYGFLAGNHDMQEDGSANYYEEYFPASRYEENEWWGGSFFNNRNNYQFFSAGGDDYIILHLQYCPTREVIDWANKVFAEYPERKAILSTHAFINNKANRIDKCNWNSNGDVDAATIWNRLVKNTSNIFLVLSGHIEGVARRTDIQDRYIYQLLSDYQAMENEGNGYLRIMTFQPSADKIIVETYSPYLDQYLTDDKNKFTLEFDMRSGIPPTGKIIISNGSEECIATLPAGSCELPLRKSGENIFSAKYGGDKNHQGSISEGFVISVED